MIWDCFTFFKELDLLELRLNELNDVVDRWVLVEMAYTHTGRPKPFYFDRNRSRFRKWLPRIEHVMVYDAPMSLDPFQRERHQRNAIQRGLRWPQQNDIIAITDVDEIPRPATFEHFRRAHFFRGIANINMRLYHYWINGVVNEPWLMPKVMTGWFYKQTVPEESRYWHYHQNPIATIEDGGWHFSWLGGISGCVAKINAVAPVIDPGAVDIRETLMRQELPNPSNEMGLHKVTPVEIDHTWPKHVLSNLEWYRGRGHIAELQTTGRPITLPRNDAGLIHTG